MDALYHGRADEAQRLLSETGSNSLTIHEAAAMGVTARLEQLLAEDPRAVNTWAEDGFQPLGLACFFGRREAAELLLARGGEVNTPARNAFKVTALLVAAGADVNARQQAGNTPLHETAQVGLVNLTRLLLEHGADPNARDDNGRTPADLAREGGNTAVLEVLAG
jgi:ankyrin repeat protein